MNPTEASPADSIRDDAGEAVPARILRRMNESGGFPALDHSVARIVDALEVGDEDTGPLVEAVLADVSLTQKVLRLANSAMYAPIGGGVSTVSHAMRVLGFQAVGHLALGVNLLGSLENMSPHSRSAERELACSLLAGSVAGGVVAKAGRRNGEIAVVCTLLHRIGSLLTAFYLPPEWERVQRAIAAGRDEEAAARDVLGMSLEELGAFMARQWRLPGSIVRTLVAEPDADAQADDAWLYAMTRFSHQSARLLASATEPADSALEALAADFGPVLGLSGADLLDAVATAAEEANAEPALAGAIARRESPATGKDPVPPALSPLRAGIAALRDALDSHGTPREVEYAALEAAFRGLDLGRVAVLRLDAEGQTYRVDACLCEREPDRLKGLCIPAGGNDLAHFSLARKRDFYIDNPRDDKIAALLPAWISCHGTHPFFLLPITDADEEAMGLLFGQQREDVKLTREELGLLAELRDLLRRRLRADA